MALDAISVCAKAKPALNQTPADTFSIRICTTIRCLCTCRKNRAWVWQIDDGASLSPQPFGPRLQGRWPLDRAAAACRG